MSKKIINWNELKRRVKFENMKRKVTDTAINIYDWAKDNKEEAIALGSVVTAVGAGLAKQANRHDRNKKLKKEQELKDLYVYDRSAGMYLKLRRPLTNFEKLELDRRHHSGESVTHILMSLRVL